MKNLLYLLIVINFLAACASSKNNRVEVGVDYKEQLSSKSELLKGIKQKHLDNNEEALNHFQKASVYNPKNDAAYYELARLSMENKAFIKAQTYINLALDNSPQNFWYLKLKNRILIKLDDKKGLIKNHERIINLFPKKRKYYIDLADIYIRMGNLPEALKILGNLESIIGITPEISLQKATLYMYLKNESALYLTYDELINKYPFKVEFKIDLAEAYLKFGHKDKAQEIFEKIDQSHPDQFKLLIKLAELAWKENDYEEYYDLLSQLFINHKVNIDHKVKLILKYFAVLENKSIFKEQSVQLSKLIINTHPNDAKAHALLGDFLYNTRRLKEAKEAYLDALKLTQSVFNVWHQLLMIEFELKNYESVIKSSDDCMVFFPNQGVLYYLKGISMIQLKQYSKSIEVLEQGLILSFGNTVLEAELQANLGEAYHQIENYTASDSCFSMALSIDSNNAIVLNNYSFYLSERNTQLNLALRYIKRAVKLRENTASFEDTYAWILYQLGQYSEALKWIEKALSNGGDKSGVINDHYGDILYQLGKTEEALKQWEKAQNLGLDTQAIQDKIRNKGINE